MLERLHLERLVAVGDLDALAAARRDGRYLVGRKGALGKNVEHLASHIAGGPDDRDLETHGCYSEKSVAARWPRGLLLGEKR